MLVEHETLKDINNDLIEVGHSLREVTEGGMECIERFCECQSIVQWIRNTTKGLYIIDTNITKFNKCLYFLSF